MKLTFFGSLAVLCFCIGIGLSNTGLIVIGIVYLIIFLFYCLYYWCIRRRLALAAAMIRLGTKVVQTNKATITLQFLTSIGLFMWWIFWVAVIILYFLAYNSSGIVVILMLFMWYWTSDVMVNVAHVTTCVVTAVWWFNKDPMVNPTWNSYRYATTRGLGSICYGSFLVAIIQTLRAIIKSGGSRGALACICYIFLSILNCLAQYFNAYAFVQVAVYGASYWQAAKNTWNLLSTRGFDAIINDNLSDTVLAAGAFVGGCITFVVGGIIGYLMFLKYGLDTGIVFGVIMAIVGFYIGYYFTLEFMFAVHSAIKAIFVCWAEDPAALQATHPLCYNLMATAWARVYGARAYDYDVTMDLD